MLECPISMFTGAVCTRWLPVNHLVVRKYLPGSTFQTSKVPSFYSPLLTAPTRRCSQNCFSGKCEPIESRVRVDEFHQPATNRDRKTRYGATGPGFSLTRSSSTRSASTSRDTPWLASPCTAASAYTAQSQASARPFDVPKTAPSAQRYSVLRYSLVICSKFLGTVARAFD